MLLPRVATIGALAAAVAAAAWTALVPADAARLVIHLPILVFVLAVGPPGTSEGVGHQA